MEQLCITCSSDLSTVSNSTKFTCPSCGEKDINRCGKCRLSAKVWKCECGFEGP
ncbi:MAG: RNA-binding protein [Candidatus Altiarchaeota archaeon]|nr:RNA-binding protein [Candidatus Altiarchaeota archaeon]